MRMCLFVLCLFCVLCFLFCVCVFFLFFFFLFFFCFCFFCFLFIIVCLFVFGSTASACLLLKKQTLLGGFVENISAAQVCLSYFIRAFISFEYQMFAAEM